MARTLDEILQQEKACVVVNAEKRARKMLKKVKRKNLRG